MSFYKKAFTDIYNSKSWDDGSGVLSGKGSTVEYTVKYRKLLSIFIKTFKISSVVDLGCGDWTFSRLMDWDGLNYLGFDVVKSVIDANNKAYKKPNINFQLADFHDPNFKFPPAELYILKDVLQHWPNLDIVKFLKRLIQSDKCLYILITNCSNSDDPRSDIKIGDWKPLNPKLYPLKQFKPQIIGVFDTKTTCVIVC